VDIIRRTKNVKMSLLDRGFNIFNFLIMLIVVIITFYPFIYIVMLSMSSGDVYGKLLFAPVGFTLKGYIACLESSNMLHGFMVSIARSTLGPICTLIVIFMGAYVLSRKDFIFRKHLSKYLIFTMYFSGGLIPVYLVISWLNLTGTFWVYIIPRLAAIYHLILIRTYIQELPKELEESAYIDGAKDYQIAFRILFPLCTPIISAIVLFQFISQWNAFTDTLIYNSMYPEYHTFQYILMGFMKMQQAFSLESYINMYESLQRMSVESIRMAMTIIVIIPIIIVYPFMQRYFIKGIMVGAIKG